MSKQGHQNLVLSPSIAVSRNSPDIALLGLYKFDFELTEISFLPMLSSFLDKKKKRIL